MLCCSLQIHHVNRVLETSKDVHHHKINSNLIRKRCKSHLFTTVVQAQAVVARKGVVITGGSKGFGLAMGREFLKAGDAVVLCGRNEQRLDAAISTLQSEVPGGEVYGIRCDVSSVGDMAALGEFAQQKLQAVHIFINNAGEVTRKRMLADVAADEIVKVTGSNVTGSLLGCREAIRIMRQQPQHARPAYHIFNLGFSRWGASFSKSACTHKATKTALTQLTQSLAEELREAGLHSIGVHNLSPGMVLTDLLLTDASPIARRFINVLADDPETVAAAVVPQIRAIQGTNQRIEYLTPVMAVGRVIAGAPQLINGSMAEASQT